MNRHWIPVVTLMFAVVVAMTHGCRDKKDEPKIVSITDGRIKKVTANADGTGEVVVSYKPEKSDTPIDGVAIVNAATEIHINGERGKLSEIAVGERVSGEVRLDKTGTVKRFVALKVNVERAKRE